MSNPIRTSLFALLLIVAVVSGAHAGNEHIIVKNGKTLAFLGDSITQQGAGLNGYATLVVYGLATRGITVKPVFAGVSGDKSSDMLIRLGGVLEQQPDHLFLAVGVNDIWHGDQGGGVPLERYKVYVTDILDRCKAAGTKVILSTIMPITENPADKKNIKAKAYSAFLDTLAKERNLPIARLHETMFAEIAKGEGKLTLDGVHPNHKGHRIIALGVLKSMGLTETELDVVKDAWDRAPEWLVLGDRQASSGGREGSWFEMVTRAINRGQKRLEVSTRITTDWRYGTGVLKELEAALVGELSERTKYILVVPPIGDVNLETPVEAYRDSLRSMAQTADKHGCKLLISTFPLINNSHEDEKTVASIPYNAIIRNVTHETSAILIPLRAMMTAYLSENPDAILVEPALRLTQEGGMLMAEGLYKAFGGDVERLPALRMSWASSRSYSMRYVDRFTLTFHLSAAGEAALNEVKARYGNVGDWTLRSAGTHLLLEGDDAANQPAIEFIRGNWLSDKRTGKALTFTIESLSLRKMWDKQAYVKAHKIDVPEFHKLAYLMGVYKLHNNDLIEDWPSNATKEKPPR